MTTVAVAVSTAVSKYCTSKWWRWTQASRGTVGSGPGKLIELPQKSLMFRGITWAKASMYWFHVPLKLLSNIMWWRRLGSLPWGSPTLGNSFTRAHRA